MQQIVWDNSGNFDTWSSFVIQLSLIRFVSYACACDAVSARISEAAHIGLSLGREFWKTPVFVVR